MQIRTVDYHTAGEPFRIVTGGRTADRRVGTVLDRRDAAMTGPADQVRAMLVNEPRGHADMYGCFLTPPDDTVPPRHAQRLPPNDTSRPTTGAVSGVLFWHKDGFSTACGHGTIALGRTRSTPAWSRPRTTARSMSCWTCRAAGSSRGSIGSMGVTGRSRSPMCRPTRSTRAVAVTTSRGEVNVDLAYGGAIYASVRAGDLGLTVTPADLPELIAIGREIRSMLDATDLARHPTRPRLSGVYGTIWYEDLGPSPGPRRARHQRNCTVFADGEVDRSPCGSGTSARLALLHADGTLPPGAILRHDSIIATTFEAHVVAEVTADGRAAVVTGRARQRVPDRRAHVRARTRDDPLPRVPAAVRPVTPPSPR